MGGERARSGSEPRTGEVPLRLHGRAEALRRANRAPLPQSLPPLRRPDARPLRHRLQGARRLVLGVTTLAAPLPMRGFDAWTAGSRRGSCTSRTGPACRCSRSRPTGRTTDLAGPVRPADLPRGSGARLQDAVRAAGRPITRGTPTSTPSTRRTAGLAARRGKVTHVRNGAFCYSFVPQAPPPGYPSSRAAGAGQRRAPPGHGDGPRRDADRRVGGAWARPLDARETRSSTRSSTGSSARTTASAAASDSTAHVEAGQPFGLLDRRPPTRRGRPAGPSRHQSTSRSTGFRSPSRTVSTVPSELFRTQPASRADSARRRRVSRKKTPWTRPDTVTRRRITGVVLPDRGRPRRRPRRGRHRHDLQPVRRLGAPPRAVACLPRCACATRPCCSSARRPATAARASRAYR